MILSIGPPIVSCREWAPCRSRWKPRAFGHSCSSLAEWLPGGTPPITSPLHSTACLSQSQPLISGESASGRCPVRTPAPACRGALATHGPGSGLVLAAAQISYTLPDQGYSLFSFSRVPSEELSDEDHPELLVFCESCRPLSRSSRI